jgi:type II secretory pathway pseudopilin PulG
MKHYNNMTRQAGMTLIELTVVLLILIGLAGLLVPYVGSFTQTTHDSTNSNNVTQLNNAMGRYITDKNHLPPHVDLLTNGVAGATGTGSCSGTPALGAVYCGLANPTVFAPVTYTVGTDDTAIESLVNSGINMAVANNPNIANKTFGTSTGMLMLDTVNSASWADAVFAQVQGVAGVGEGMSDGTVEGHLAVALGRDPMVYNSTCYDYIGVGIGDNNELIQSTMAAAPVYFPQDATKGPAERYAHFIAILQVDKNNDTVTDKCSGVTEKAKFLGVVANVPDTESKALIGANTLLAQGWTNRAAN